MNISILKTPMKGHKHCYCLYLEILSKPTVLIGKDFDID